jgi:hypothetical protein
MVVEDESGPVIELVLDGQEVLGPSGCSGRCPSESSHAAGHWTLLCLSSGVGEAVERGGCAGGGLDTAV